MFDDFNPLRDRKQPSEKKKKPALLSFGFFVVGVLGGIFLLGWGLFFFVLEFIYAVILGKGWEFETLNFVLALHSQGRLAHKDEMLTPLHEILDQIPASPVLIFGGAALLIIAKDIAQSRRDQD